MIKDSGNRREFDSGAVRDMGDDKGRCDLLPLDIIGDHFNDEILLAIDNYIRLGDKVFLWGAIEMFCRKAYEDGPKCDSRYTGILEVAKHYEDGAKKYEERNWEKGIPLHCYIDSAVRHYLKWLRNDEDEPHDQAFIWNLLGAIWTRKHHPELSDLPFAKDGDIK